MSTRTGDTWAAAASAAGSVLPHCVSMPRLGCSGKHQHRSVVTYTHTYIRIYTYIYIYIYIYICIYRTRPSAITRGLLISMKMEVAVVSLKQMYQCPHGLQRSRCIPCGGTKQIKTKCIHGRQRTHCVDCGRRKYKYLCPHQKHKQKCLECFLFKHTVWSTTTTWLPTRSQSIGRPIKSCGVECQRVNPGFRRQRV